MSDGNAVGPVGPSHNSSLIDQDAIDGAWKAPFQQAAQEFGEGFEVGAGFSMAVMGAGVNAVTSMAKGHVKGNFG